MGAEVEEQPADVHVCRELDRGFGRARACAASLRRLLLDGDGALLRAALVALAAAHHGDGAQRGGRRDDCAHQRAAPQLGVGGGEQADRLQHLGGPLLLGQQVAVEDRLQQQAGRDKALADELAAGLVPGLRRRIEPAGAASLVPLGVCATRLAGLLQQPEPLGQQVVGGVITSEAQLDRPQEAQLVQLFAALRRGLAARTRGPVRHLGRVELQALRRAHVEPRWWCGTAGKAHHIIIVGRRVVARGGALVRRLGGGGGSTFARGLGAGGLRWRGHVHPTRARAGRRRDKGVVRTTTTESSLKSTAPRI